ncbi:histidinol-phosphate transaminase [Aciduricibacillus chroicocephali]|uniref:Histidinol-phosphate aminotransferase n=1 Tax=Aciduricibacillus chroicocephali TaxID=3054939 RepID=A0ABY9KUJ6_9BACI|nr:histidinol-phosphate transaminase [Bacillaceae bacterium 44XB]
MEGKDILKELRPYEQGMQTEEVKRKYNLDHIVKLASNENPFGFSPKVKSVLKDADIDFNIYPDGHATELSSALAIHLSIEEDEIAFSSGLDEMILIISRCFLEKGKNTVMAVPTFPQYKHQARIEGAEAREVPLKETGDHDLDEMLAQIDEDTAIVWICSPNNPTGCPITEEQLNRFMDQCPNNVLVVLDEAYYEFARKESDLHALDKFRKYPNLLILRTFSKAYGLAGLRIGYAIGNSSIIGKLNVARGPFNTSSIAQKAAVAALGDQSFINEVTVKNIEIREDFAEFLNSIGWECFISETNFLLVKTPTDDIEVFQKLLERGFIIRPGSKVGWPQTIRVTIGKADDMELMKQAIREIDAVFAKVEE